MNLIARAGAKFKPKGRPHPKKKHLSLSTSQPTTLSTLLPKEILSTTQSQDPVSLHGFVSSLFQPTFIFYAVQKYLKIWDSVLQMFQLLSLIVVDSLTNPPLEQSLKR